MGLEREEAMRNALWLLLLSGCASTPTPDFEAQRSSLFQRSEVICFMSLAPAIREKYPEEADRSAVVLINRGVVCNYAMAQEGSKLIIAQAEREERLAATQSQERQASASRFGDKLMRGLAGFATGYAIGSAMTPPPTMPPPPVNCVTTYSYGRAYTTCH
jgi:hypothetical protein